MTTKASQTPEQAAKRSYKASIRKLKALGGYSTLDGMQRYHDQFLKTKQLLNELIWEESRQQQRSLLSLGPIGGGATGEN